MPDLVQPGLVQPGLVQPVDWLAVGPPLAVALTAIAVLLVGVFAPAGARRGAVTWTSLAGIAVGLVLLLPLRGGVREVFCTGGQANEFVGPPSCSYVVDATTLVFQLLALGGVAVVVLLSTRETLGGGLPTGEYHFLLLASASGAMTLAAARDLITLVVALELVSLPAFALVGLRGGDRRSAEAALKFFLVSVVSVAVMLFGVSLVYGVTGTVYLDQIAVALDTDLARGPAAVAAVGVVLTLVGLAFKVAAVPFHFWVPDTYVGAPVPVAAYLSVVSKAAGFVGLLLIVSIAFAPYAGVWSPILAVLAALTMTLGNLVALRQRNAVRLLAWSSVAQAGYLLVPLGAVGASRSSGGSVADPAAEGLLASTVAYLLVYAVVNLGAFAVVALVVGERSARAPRDGDGAGRGRLLADYRGLFWTEPLRAGALAFFLLALAGLPPGVVGLFAKVVVFRAAVDGGAGWLAVVMAVNVVIALAYYLYWTALLFAEPEGGRERARGSSAPARSRPVLASAAIGVTAVLGVLLSVAPGFALDVLRDLPLPL